MLVSNLWEAGTNLLVGGIYTRGTSLMVGSVYIGGGGGLELKERAAKLGLGCFFGDRLNH
jgi:hypothetical protein